MWRAALLLMMGACSPFSTTAPGRFTIPLGSHLSADVDLSAVSYSGSLARIAPRPQRTGFRERGAFLYGALPGPDGVGLIFHIHQEF